MRRVRNDGGKTRGSLVAALAALGLIATAANAAFRTDGIASAPPARLRSATPRPVWAPNQVNELIRIVQESRGHGLDPDDYGLAALRAELEQSTTLYRSSGSRQLDALAAASAMALARAYHAERPIDRAGLNAALRANTLRAWIDAPARPERS